MRVLLLGAGGMLATDLAREAPPDVELRTLSHAECDITDAAALARELGRAAPDVVINATAYTAVDRAETEREVAERVNGTAVGQLGVLCAERGTRVIHFSTDYVFPGDASRPYREDDAVAPLNAYGASKLLGETLLARSGARYCVVRTQWLFGRNGRSFPRTMWERARAGQPTRVVADQQGRPTYTVDLARATWAVVAAGNTGILHAANRGATTWFGLAQRVFDRAGAGELLSPCATADYPTPAKRPEFSVLDTARLDAIPGGVMPAWEDAVDRFLDEIAG